MRKDAFSHVTCKLIIIRRRNSDNGCHRIQMLFSVSLPLHQIYDSNIEKKWKKIAMCSVPCQLPHVLYFPGLKPGAGLPDDRSIALRRTFLFAIYTWIWYRQVWTHLVCIGVKCKNTFEAILTKDNVAGCPPTHSRTRAHSLGS
jgi:hypothetical protein